MIHSIEKREEAVRLFELGYGCDSTASTLGIPRQTVEKWLYAFRALGKEALFVTTHKKYSYELKIQAVRDIVETGMTKLEVMERYGIASLTALENWCRMYRAGGPDALLPKLKGRPPKSDAPTFANREEELEARIRELELELEIQKRINALADEIERRSHRR